MVYVKPLPRTDSFSRLAKIAQPFPMKALVLRKIAEKYDFSKDMVDFLARFQGDEIFDNRADFLTRCEEIEMMINEERKMPIESHSTPQED